MAPYIRRREDIVPTAEEMSLIARAVRTMDPKVKGIGHRGSTQASIDILAAMPLMSRAADSVYAL